ncbi:MAG: site-specific DNA-methyltransferase [Pirellulales bacterium]
MAKKRTKPKKKEIEQYAHPDKRRANNPPVGLVTPETDPVQPTHKTYEYDPHLDPQLIWAGKAERMSFEVPTVSLHVHERIDPKAIIQAVRTNGDRLADGKSRQQSLFEEPEQNPPLRDALDFYKHPHGWTNRLIAGDSLLVMNSLLEKEGLAGKVQMIYIDPPYGIRYGSNFQPFVNRRDVKDGKDEDLTQEPETLKAFRDTWELGIHSYLTYLRDRLLLARELLHESGSVFVQISDENLHHVRELMDEVMGVSNFVANISFNKSSGLGGNLLPSVNDYIVWYAKQKSTVKFRSLFTTKVAGEESGGRYNFVSLPDGERRRLKQSEIANLGLLPTGSKVFAVSDPTAQGFRPNTTIDFEFEGRVYHPGANRCWRSTKEGLDRLVLAGRLIPTGNSLSYVRYIDDFPAFPRNNVWTDVGGIMSRSDPKVYAVQTSTTAIVRCLLMTTDPGDCKHHSNTTARHRLYSAGRNVQRS